MMENINNMNDNFIDDEILFSIPNFVELTDDDEFRKKENNQEEDEYITDLEFESLLSDLGINMDKTKLDYETYESSANEMELEEQLMSNKLDLERRLLDYEREKFEREKEEWEKSRKLSEEKLQAQIMEFEKYKKLEKEKMYLETRELISSCTNLSEFLENYKKIHDVSE